MVQGLASGSVGSWHEVHRTSLGLRSASVVAEQTSPGRLATHLPRGFGYRGAGAPWFKVSPPARSARGMRPPRTSLGLRFGRCGAGAPILNDKTGKVRFL